ncbi:MAG: hypothetical protein H0W12_08465, partial [Chitinophagaceae bacterium]|nr:hypothetical protein [Chitinophagaceae bacterium]
IDLNETDNDIDLYTLTSNDSDNVTFKNPAYGITPPAWHSRDKETMKPMHFHFTTFTASEVAFTISGFAQVISSKGNSEDLGTASITGSGHFYREPKYIKSEVLPGCDCDPTIYAKTYDPETLTRSKSGCEAALRNKLFDAVQKSMVPLFTNIDFHGQGSMTAGDIHVGMIPGSADISVPVNDFPYCSVDYYHLGSTGIDAQKKNFTNDDGFGLRLMKMADLTSQPVSTNNLQEMFQKQAAFVDSLQKLMQANKITMEQFTKAAQNYSDKHPMTMPANDGMDIKKMEAENNLYISFIFNSSNNTDGYLKLADKEKTIVQHNIKGSAFEIYSPMMKDNDGSWLPNRMGIYFGKFTTPVPGKVGAGWDAEATTAVYPPNGNKLTIYNIIIKMEGGKDLIDKAIANIDFSVLQGLIIKQ